MNTARRGSTGTFLGWSGQSILWLFLGGFLLLPVTPGSAHEGRPVYVEINQVGKLRYAARWKYPPSLPLQAAPSLLLPLDCQSVIPQPFPEANATTGRVIYQCAEELSGKLIGLRYPLQNPALSALFRVTFSSGETHSRLLQPGETSWILPRVETPFAVARQYALLGVRHIWTGPDHLLFVACLVALAGTRRRIVIAITGFTLAHSLTLVLAALQWISLPLPPVEACIALSILLLATELAREDQRSWSRRYPILVASSFGLLHGLGFAAILRETGLPQTELFVGLLFFNLGVEAGQLLFLAGLWMLFASAQRIRLADRIDLSEPPPAARLTVIYLIGALAGFWLIDRTMRLLV